MLLPDFELKVMTNKYLHADQIEWFEYLRTIREIYDMNNDEIMDNLIHLGFIEPGVL